MNLGCKGHICFHVPGASSHTDVWRETVTCIASKLLPKGCEKSVANISKQVLRWWAEQRPPNLTQWSSQVVYICSSRCGLRTLKNGQITVLLVNNFCCLIILIISCWEVALELGLNSTHFKMKNSAKLALLSRKEEREKEHWGEISSSLQECVEDTGTAERNCVMVTVGSTGQPLEGWKMQWLSLLRFVRTDSKHLSKKKPNQLGIVGLPSGAGAGDHLRSLSNINLHHSLFWDFMFGFHLLHYDLSLFAGFMSTVASGLCF